VVIDAKITILEPASAGKLTIEVAADHTADLPAGVYTDALRADLLTKRSTLWSGRVLISANLFAAA
jgi:hypothetical protein